MRQRELDARGPVGQTESGIPAMVIAKIPKQNGAADATGHQDCNKKLAQ